MHRVQTPPSHPLIVVFTGGKRREIKTLNLEMYPSQQMVKHCTTVSLVNNILSRKIECKNLRLRLQGTRKLGYLAHISVKQYTLYPAYQIAENEKIKLGSWKLRQLREERLTQLRGYKIWQPIKGDPIFRIFAYPGCSHQTSNRWREWICSESTSAHSSENIWTCLRRYDGSTWSEKGSQAVRTHTLFTTIPMSATTVRSCLPPKSTWSPESCTQSQKSSRAFQNWPGEPSPKGKTVETRRTQCKPLFLPLHYGWCPPIASDRQKGKTKHLR